MITAVDLLRGIARLVGWNVIEVPGATGYTDTDYAAKGQYAIDNLEHTDVICIHVEATDEASHEGDVAKKIEALQEIDSKIVAPVCKALESIPHRIMITPDHPTFVRTKTHTHGFVPFTIAGHGVTADSATTYDEVTAAASAHRFPKGYELMDFFLN
jgi:2,3-bisphosphoglycerate-independent phosphoglycerate mutase